MLGPVQVLVAPVRDGAAGEDLVAALRQLHGGDAVRLLDAFVVTGTPDGGDSASGNELCLVVRQRISLANDQT
jgi:hypothetical protein